jgi:replication factor C subunit 1
MHFSCCVILLGLASVAHHKFFLFRFVFFAGKSTAVSVIARQLGFEVVEFNASDVRNKKSLKDEVGDITGNRGMGEFYTAVKLAPPASGAAASASAAAAKPVVKKQPVIVMDEVDGMGGNVSGN